MESDIALAVGNALLPKLESFHEIEGRPLVSIWHVEQLGDLVRLILEFEAVSLIISAVEDDSIDFKATTALEPKIAPDHIRRSEFWKDFVGLPFGWGWVTINQQGYCDGLLLSFGGIEPQILINVVASSLKLCRISR